MEQKYSLLEGRCYSNKDRCIVCVKMLADNGFVMQVLMPIDQHDRPSVPTVPQKKPVNYCSNYVVDVLSFL